MRNKLSLVSYLIKITGTTSKSNSNENGSRDYNKSIENINWKTCSGGGGGIHKLWSIRDEGKGEEF